MSVMDVFIVNVALHTIGAHLREVRYRREDIDAWIARRTTSRPRGTRS